MIYQGTLSDPKHSFVLPHPPTFPTGKNNCFNRYFFVHFAQKQVAFSLSHGSLPALFPPKDG
jgi:hypothetical protein